MTNVSTESGEEERQETTNVEEQKAQEPQQVTVSDIELDSLRREAEEYKDKYFRLLAESENARKRMQKEKVELTQYALQNMVCDILHPIDQMENALKHADQMSEEIK
ncbi:MAG: nucleotide exchange factor GrpE, partial [Myxococcota bacterium]